MSIKNRKSTGTLAWILANRSQEGLKMTEKRMDQIIQKDEELRKLASDIATNPAVLSSSIQELSEGSFVYGFHYGIDHQWIEASQKLPYMDESLIRDDDKDATLEVFCQSKAGIYYADHMIKCNSWKWMWSQKESFDTEFWMPIPETRVSSN